MAFDNNMFPVNNRAVAELVDAPDLGSGALCVWVRVPPARQYWYSFEYITSTKNYNAQIAQTEEQESSKF